MEGVILHFYESFWLYLYLFPVKKKTKAYA